MVHFLQDLDRDQAQRVASLNDRFLAPSVHLPSSWAQNVKEIRFRKVEGDQLLSTRYVVSVWMIIRSESSDRLVLLCCALRCALRTSNPPVALFFFLGRASVPRTSTRYSSLRRMLLDGDVYYTKIDVQLTILDEVSPGEVLRHPLHPPAVYQIYFASIEAAHSVAVPDCSTAYLTPRPSWCCRTWSSDLGT